MLRSVYNWLDKRLYLTKLFRSTAGHHVPASSGSWFYVFGSATLLCFILQIITGTLLALVYVPSTNEAWNSLQYLNHVQYLGWYLRALHNWGSNFMVALMTIHMVQVFLFGAYKYPRELTWVSGVFLLVATLAMAFTGQVMRFDEDAYWGLGIGASITGRVPLIGDRLVHLLLGGPIIAGETLSRFFALHIFVIPAINHRHRQHAPAPGAYKGHQRISGARQTGTPEYVRWRVRKGHEKQGVPFVPNAIGKDLIFAALVMVLILACSAIFGPAGPSGPPDPTSVDTVPRPDFYFLSVFAALALLPDWMETVVLFVAPVMMVGLLFILPFISGTGEKSARKRPVAVLSVITIFLVLGMLTYMGDTSPWSPKMKAWSSQPVPVDLLQHRTPLETRGALVLQNKQCRNCHSPEGHGGQAGPALGRSVTG